MPPGARAGIGLLGTRGRASACACAAALAPGAADEAVDVAGLPTTGGREGAAVGAGDGLGASEVPAALALPATPDLGAGTGLAETAGLTAAAGLPALLDAPAALALPEPLGLDFDGAAAEAAERDAGAGLRAGAAGFFVVLLLLREGFATGFFAAIRHS
jgi:hypothetical protein